MIKAARIKPEAEEPGKISNREPRQTRENYSLSVPAVGGESDKG